MSHLKRPTDLIRHLEDSFLKLTAALFCCRAWRLEFGSTWCFTAPTQNWEALRKTLTYYEEQLRLCEAPGSSGRALQEKVCATAGRKGTLRRSAGSGSERRSKQRQGRERKRRPRKAERKGRGDKTSKGGNTPCGSEKSKGDKNGKGKKNKKKKKGPGKGRSLSESGEPESLSAPPATVMALRFAVPSASEKALPEPSAFRGRVLIRSEVPTRPES